MQLDLRFEVALAATQFNVSSSSAAGTRRWTLQHRNEWALYPFLQTGCVQKGAPGQATPPPSPPPSRGCTCADDEPGRIHPTAPTRQEIHVRTPPNPSGDCHHHAGGTRPQRLRRAAQALAPSRASQPAFSPPPARRSRAHPSPPMPGMQQRPSAAAQHATPALSYTHDPPTSPRLPCARSLQQPQHPPPTRNVYTLPVVVRAAALPVTAPRTRRVSSARRRRRLSQSALMRLSRTRRRPAGAVPSSRLRRPSQQWTGCASSAAVPWP